MIRNPGFSDGIIVEVLAFFAGRPQVMMKFMSATGMQLQDLRRATTEQGFGVALLDFLLEDDALVTEFSDAAKICPGEVLRARTILAGPGSYGWETG